MFCLSWETFFKLPRGEGAASRVSGIGLVLAANLGSRCPEKSFHCPEPHLPHYLRRCLESRGLILRKARMNSFALE